MIKSENRSVSTMAEYEDLDSVLTTLCSTSRNKDDTNYTKLFDVSQRLRRLLLLDAGEIPVPAVLNNDVVFKSVFCFLLDARRAVQYLEELGRSDVTGWSALTEMEPMAFIQKIRTQSASEDEKTAVIVVFLCSVLRLSVTVIDTLDLAKEARVRKNRKGLDGEDSEDRIADVQQGLNKALINCVHLEKLMQSRNSEERASAVCDEQTRQMFSGFSILAQLVYDHGDYVALREMMSLSENVFQLAHEVQESVVDLKVDISQRFLPRMIRTLLAVDPELSYSVPFRMYRHYMYVQMEQKVSRDEDWRTDQQLSNANHYCADQGMIYHDGRYAFICWLLYGLSLFDCGQYATAEAILKMDYLKTATETLPSSKTAADCIRKCADQAAHDGMARKEFLLYFADVSPTSFTPETTVWHSIYEDPAFRKYSPRHIPDYMEICRHLMKSDDLPEDTIQSLVLESVGPMIDLAYQPKKPTKMVRSDNSVNIYGGSVNENLDVQSHIGVVGSKEEVPDIDMMMAITPSQIGLDAKLDSSATSPRYAYLLKSETDERLPSFELLVDSLPIALNKVAEFVADTAFAEEYEILSISIHGPAIATKIRRGDTILSYDHVPAFWIKRWPDVAGEWITRQRQFGWPSVSVIDEIIQNGVLLVAACHSNSTDPNNEWRISFTIAERILVDTLSSTQRLAYLYAKLIWMSSLKSSSFLVSYHLKNALLWLCEERSSEFWKGGKLVVCIREIFRWLHRDISDGHLRNYFIATDNMIPTWVESTDDLVHSLDHIIDKTFQVNITINPGA